MCYKNAKYTSKTTQNELIFECGEYIKERIIYDIKKAKYEYIEIQYLLLLYLKDVYSIEIIHICCLL